MQRTPHRRRNDNPGFGRDKAAVASIAMEGAENYARWQLEVMSSHLTSRVLELGCGSGTFTTTLVGRERVVSVDVDAAMVEHVRGRVATSQDWVGVVADICDPSFADRVRQYECSSATALNVIEHLADDLSALRSIRRALPPGGKVAVLVPAHQALYGTLDVAAGHHRRYTTGELTDKLQDAGFLVDEVFYFNMVGTIGWFLNGRLLRRQRVDRATVSQVALFDRYVVPLARRLERRWTAPFGLSVVGLGTAPSDAMPTGS